MPWQSAAATDIPGNTPTRSVRRAGLGLLRAVERGHLRDRDRRLSPRQRLRRESLRPPLKIPGRRLNSAELAIRFLLENHDERIDELDAAFGQLTLWIDASEVRKCTPNELVPLSKLGIVSIGLRDDEQPPLVQGSYEGEHAVLEFRDNRGGLALGRVVDVHLSPLATSARQ